MSKASTGKRARLTLLLGAVTTVAFGGVFWIVAHRAAETPPATVYAAAVAAVAPTAAPTTSAQGSVASTATQATAVTSVPAATAAATPVPTAAAHAQTKAS